MAVVIQGSLLLPMSASCVHEPGDSTVECGVGLLQNPKSPGAQLSAIQRLMSPFFLLLSKSSARTSQGRNLSSIRNSQGKGFWKIKSGSLVSIRVLQGANTKLELEVII